MIAAGDERTLPFTLRGLAPLVLVDIWAGRVDQARSRKYLSCARRRRCWTTKRSCGNKVKNRQVMMSAMLSDYAEAIRVGHQVMSVITRASNGQ